MVKTGQEESQELQNPKSRYFRLAGMEFTYWLAMAVGSYVNAFLQSLGLPASQVGLITSLNAGVGIFSTPFWGMVSDKIRSIKKVFILCLIGFSLIFVLVPLSTQVRMWGVTLMMVIVPAIYLFRPPLDSLLDSWMVRASNKSGLNYGTIRCMGSLSYFMMGMILGVVLPYTGMTGTFYFCPVLLIPLLILCLKEKDEEGARSKRTLSLREMRVSRLFRNYFYMSFLIYSVLINLSTAGGNTFLPYLVQEAGGSLTQVGFVMGYSALLEIPMLLLLKPLRQRIPLYVFLIFAGLFYSIQFLCYSQAASLAQVVAFATFGGLGTGSILAGGGNYVFALAPEELKATAWTMKVSLDYVAAIIGNLVSGILIEGVGIRSYYGITGLLLFGAMLFYVCTFVFGTRVLKLEKPGLNR